MAPAAVAFAVTPRFPSLRAVAGDAEDEWGKEPADQGGAASTVAEAPVASEVAEMKVNLKEALYGMERGLRASSETQAEVVEIITLNLMPAPTEAPTLLNGKWILAYTAFIPLYP